MAGSFAEARTQILSLRPQILQAKAGQLREFGIDSRLGGSTLAASADEVGAQRGAPYAAYQERITPTATWMRGLAEPATTTADGLVGAAEAGARAQMVLAQQEAALAALAASPTTTAGQFEAAQAQALVALNQAIDAVTQAYRVVTPAAPGTAPVLVGAAAGANGPDAPGGSVLAQPPRMALGPESGPFAGYLHDPTTGNLVDPATGREVDADGRFLDPITGQPFGSPASFATRLEGLVGGPAPAAPGVAPLGVGAPAVAAPGVAPVGGAAAGVGVPFVPPGVVGLTGPAASRGGSGRIAGLYGGALPPSLLGNNPAGGQLREAAARSLDAKAAAAQRYAAIAGGQAPPPVGFFPPMVGVGMAGVGMAGGRAGRPARRGTAPTVTEPDGVWGAVPADRRRTPLRDGGPVSETEAADVWTGGGRPPAAVLDGPQADQRRPPTSTPVRL